MVLSLRNCTSDLVGLGMRCTTATCRATSPISSSSVGAVRRVLQTGLPHRNSYMLRSLSSDRFAEVPDGLQAGVDRWQDLRHRSGLVGDDLYAHDDCAERGPDGSEMEDDPQ